MVNFCLICRLYLTDLNDFTSFSALFKRLQYGSFFLESHIAPISLVMVF